MPSEAQEFINEVWGLQGVAYLALALRYYSRITTLGWRKFSLDDYMIALATLVYTAESVAAYFVVAYWKGLSNNGMTEEQRAALDPNSEEWQVRVNGSKTHVIGLLLYATLLWMLKGCWTVYYFRLTAGLQTPKRMVKWAFFIMPLTYIACLLVAIFKCVPFHHQWQISPSPGNNCMPAISYLQTLFVMVMNVFTDIYLMAIPIPMVWRSHLPWRKKITLILMFSGGLLETAFGILRCVSILTVGDRDPAQSGYWSVRESFVSYVLANMPMLYPLLKKFFERVGCSITLSSPRGASGQAASSGQAYRLGGYPHSRSKPRSKDPDPIPEETRYGSDEHIIFACTECSRTASSSQDTTRAEVDTKERHVHSPFQHGNNHTKVFRGPGHLKSKPSLSSAPATGGILVTKDIVVSEVHGSPGASRGGEAYFEV
ncbi:hypothetical protein VPNG_08351 [Cytospora leucostoma]|uniref:Rhodopsin domain-containing protein n=1 Tax=Cytospora leucostoma TaxID=1230097 RepID=A0A423W9H0_9PEZI|nr:hypothetical protein VPNG_08351 [Cytospora leucostoma]